nr:class I SAM-dependent methyltransferase [uncultured Oscillibacter sp.]
MEKSLRHAVIEWDIITWGRAVDFWNTDKLSSAEKRGGGGMSSSKGHSLVLDIGSRGGGLSLLFARLGYRVHCTDLTDPKESAGPLHRQYGVEDRIVYRALDALELDAVDQYGIICFKSVLGGVGHDGHYDAQEKMMENIYRALKPGGYLLFVENTTASALHRFFRRRFVPWGKSWRYITLAEAQTLCRQFSEVRSKSFGFLSAFGRSGRQRAVLGSVDALFDRFLPAGMKYCVSVVAKK